MIKTHRDHDSRPTSSAGGRRDPKGGLSRLSGCVAHGLRCTASLHRSLLTENLDNPSLCIFIIAPWYKDIDGTTLSLTPGLRESIRHADQFSDNFCRDVDTHIEQMGHNAPAGEVEPAHASATALDHYAELDHLDFAAEGITAVIWATGFRFDYSWIPANIFDDFGYPVTKRGETAVPGLYFLGLNFLHSRKSGIIYGVGEDAEHIEARIRVFLEKFSA